jgi:hypothetical protein
MSYRYRFIDHKTNETVTLDEIDKRICQDINYPYDPKRYCPMYQWLTLIGLSPRIRGIDDNVDNEFPDTTEQEKQLIIKYLVDDYTFDAWFQRH